MIEAKLAELGITLPQPAAPVASYVPAVEANGMLFISGQLPFVDGKVLTGRVGDTCDLEDAKVAAKGKPVVLSTGASTLGEVDIAVEALTQAGCADIALLHCILNYPTDNANAHLRMIEGLKRAYPRNIIGYSDHTLPDDAMTSLVTAHLLGAVIIEKHFTHDKTLPGNDHYHAMDQQDLARFVLLAEKVHVLLGASDHKAPIVTEAISRKNARRSIVLACDVSAGQQLTAADLTYKRPGTGISPIHWDEVIGRKTAQALEADHVLQWQDLAKEA